MPRASELFLDDSGAVQVRLKLYRDEVSNLLMDGQINATVHMACQRCLCEVATTISHEICLQLVRDDEAAQRVMKDREPMIVGEEILIAEMIEEELLLALPLAASHEKIEDCDPAGLQWKPEPIPEPELTEREAGKRNPFADLREQMNKKAGTSGDQNQD